MVLNKHFSTKNEYLLISSASFERSFSVNSHDTYVDEQGLINQILIIQDKVQSSHTGKRRWPNYHPS